MVVKTKFQNKKSALNYLKALCKKRNGTKISEFYVNSGSEKTHIPNGYDAVGVDCIVYTVNAKGNSVSRKYNYIALYKK